MGWESWDGWDEMDGMKLIQWDHLKKYVMKHIYEIHEIPKI